MKSVIGYIKNLSGFFGDEKELLNFPITDNCNSKCIMCNVWKDKVQGELGPVEIKAYFDMAIMKKIKHVGISGGEPTLRRDLPECVESIFQSAKELVTLSITSHGYHFNRWERFAPRLKKLSENYGVALSVNISIDGCGVVHDAVRGIEGAYNRAVKTIDILLAVGIPVQIQCTISKTNVYSLVDVLFFAKQKKIDVVFRCATTIERLYNSEIIEGVSLDPHQKSYLSDFFKSEILHSQTRSVGRGLYYEWMGNWLLYGGSRTMPCYFQRKGYLLSSKGEISPCSVSSQVIAPATKSNMPPVVSGAHEAIVRNKLIFEECGSCIHDQSGAWPLRTLLSYLLRRRSGSLFYRWAGIIHKAVNFGIVLLNTLFKIYFVKKIEIDSNKVKKILVIGAYGGEHVGDAAILGGVVLRCLKRYPNLHEVYVCSFRPDRTNRWVDSLDVPVKVKVLDSSVVYPDQLFVDLLVYGGGPLMELPVHLIKHLGLAVSYLKLNIPLSLEGVGVGPLKTSISKFLVSRLLLLSSYTRVRTDQASKDAFSLAEVKVDKGPDPAFDYLSSRKLLTKVSVIEMDSLTQLNINNSRRYKIAINLRPLWSKYSFVAGLSLAELQDQYLEQIALCFEKMGSHFDVEFVYFPMNADQYGMSDLNMAALLIDKLHTKGLQMQVWRAEPGVDALLQFIRNMDCVVSMRFHGCIFGLSQNASNVVAIDYQVGKAGKVFDVMNDSGAGSKVIRVDEISAEKLEVLIKDAISSVRPLVRKLV